MSVLDRRAAAKKAILRFVVFELDVQAVFDADLHLDGVVAIWRHPERVHPNVLLLVHVRNPPRYRDADEIPTSEHQGLRSSGCQTMLTGV